MVSGLDWKGLDLRCGLVIVVCSSAKHFHLRVPLSNQEYTCKWAQVNSGKAEEMLRGNLMMDWHPIQGGVKILLVASCYGNWDQLWLDKIQTSPF